MATLQQSVLSSRKTPAGSQTLFSRRLPFVNIAMISTSGDSVLLPQSPGSLVPRLACIVERLSARPTTHSIPNGTFSPPTITPCVMPPPTLHTSSSKSWSTMKPTVGAEFSISTQPSRPIATGPLILAYMNLDTILQD